MLQKKFHFFFFLIFGIVACSSPSAQSGQFPNGQTIQLKGKMGTVELPSFFDRTDLNRLMEENLILRKDTSFLKSIELSLASFSFEEDELDVFVDTTSELRCLIIADGEKFKIDEEAGGFLDEKIANQFKRLEEENLFLEIHKIDANLKIKDKIAILKNKYEFVDALNRVSYYRSIFFISNPSRSLLVIEISIDGNDIEDYLWTLKG